jgi:hypothetical protein
MLSINYDFIGEGATSQNKQQWKTGNSEIQGSFTSFRMTTLNKQPQIPSG